MYGFIFNLEKPWEGAEEYQELVRVLGFAAGSLNSNPTPEEREAYDKVAKACAAFINLSQKQ